MCTAIHYKTKDAYFGRTLDLEYSYKEEVVVTPRHFPLMFRNGDALESHYAIIGMAMVEDGYPLYYEAANEHGLAVAGLNFPGNAHYFEAQADKDNITPFELIPWLLGQCKNLQEARCRLDRINLWNVPFSDAWPLSPLHWLVADQSGALVVESMAEGLKIYDDPVGVLTNNPPFDYHMTHLCDYLNLTHLPPVNRFGAVELAPYSRGMGAMGLPGDLSSASRFVRAAFVKSNAVAEGEETSSVSQFFHILASVEQQRGCVQMPDGRYEITVYTSCINLDKGIYYYTTYENSAPCAVDMHRCQLDAESLFSYPLEKSQRICWQN